MAKWGEGDPRWIVEERPDATNVNNWHWTEKDASHWSQEKIKDLLTNAVIEGEVGKCKIKEVSKIEGEASANNRKAKLIFFYEWNVKLNWTGQLKDGNDEVEGKLEILNLSEENSADEIDIEVSVEGTTEAASKLKELMRSQGLVVVREKVDQYIRDLKEEFASGMILPRNEGSPTVKRSVKNSVGANTTADRTATAIKKLDIGGGGITTSKLTLKQSFKCTAEDLYHTFTLPEWVQAFTRGPCKVNPRKDGEFEMFGGNVSGKFTVLIPNKVIEQTWRFKQWPQGHYSIVRLEIEQRDDTTDVTLVQSGIPDNDLERTREGWNHYYWESIKSAFGFGAALL